VRSRQHIKGHRTFGHGQPAIVGLSPADLVPLRPVGRTPFGKLTPSGHIRLKRIVITGYGKPIVGRIIGEADEVVLPPPE
jgi:hypothetical protein